MPSSSSCLSSSLHWAPAPTCAACAALCTLGWAAVGDSHRAWQPVPFLRYANAHAVPTAFCPAPCPALALPHIRSHRPAHRPAPARLNPQLQATLLNACIIGGCNVAGTVVSLVLADRAGRRGLLLQGGVQVGAC